MHDIIVTEKKSDPVKAGSMLGHLQDYFLALSSELTRLAGNEHGEYAFVCIKRNSAYELTGEIVFPTLSPSYPLDEEGLCASFLVKAQAETAQKVRVRIVRMDVDENPSSKRDIERRWRQSRGKLHHEGQLRAAVRPNIDKMEYPLRAREITIDSLQDVSEISALVAGFVHRQAGRVRDGSAVLQQIQQLKL